MHRTKRRAMLRRKEHSCLLKSLGTDGGGPLRAASSTAHRLPGASYKRRRQRSCSYTSRGQELMCSYELHPLVLSVPERNGVDKVVTGAFGLLRYFGAIFHLLFH